MTYLIFSASSDFAQQELAIAGATTAGPVISVYRPHNLPAGAKTPTLFAQRWSGYTSLLLGKLNALITVGASVESAPGASDAGAKDEPLIGEMYKRDWTIVAVDMFGPWLNTSTPTTVNPDDGGALPGLGMTHPPGMKEIEQGGTGLDGADGWDNINHWNGFKCLAAAIQLARENADTWGLDTRNFFTTGTMGADVTQKSGSASGTASLWPHLAPDLADPTKSDYRRQSTRTRGCVTANFQDTIFYDQTTGDMGTTPTAGLGGLMHFPKADEADWLSVLAESYDQVPAGYQEWFSPFHLLGGNAAARNRNKNARIYCYSAGYSQGGTTVALNSAGTPITVAATPLAGTDTEHGGKYYDLSDVIDVAYTADSDDRATNRHSPLVCAALMERVVDLNSNTTSRFVTDSGTETALLAAGATDIIYGTNYADTNTIQRILDAADWLEAQLA